jgi:periplasmic divalent cation tolerance protein
MSYSVVFITAEDQKQAEKIANALVEHKLAACVNIIPKIRSIFIWKGKKDSCDELLLIAKTRSKNFNKLKQKVKQLHSYDVPEIISIPIEKGDKRYLDWIGMEV